MFFKENLLLHSLKEKVIHVWNDMRASVKKKKEVGKLFL